MTHTLSLEKELYVPRELVFQVWTQADHLSGWYAPIANAGCHAEVDARVGGEFLLTWTNASASTFVQRGEYLEIIQPEGFRCTVSLEGAYACHVTTELDVQLVERGSSTRILITQSGFPTADFRDRVRSDWVAVLQQLEVYFSQI